MINSAPQLQVIRQGLKLWNDISVSTSYPGSGANLFDISGSERDLTLSTISFDSANGGNLRTNGSTSFGGQSYTAGAPYDLNITKKMSIQFWMRYDDMTRGADGGFAFGILFGNNASAHLQWQVFKNGQQFAVAVYNLTNAKVCFMTNGSPTYPTPIPMFNNVWYNIAFTYDHAANKMEAYLDGIKATSAYEDFLQPPSFPLPAISWQGFSFLGNFNFGVKYPPLGNMGEFLLYDTKLNDAEILHNFKVTQRRFK